jgi:hypothetical protein
MFILAIAGLMPLASLNAQDPELPPDDDSGYQELDVPLTGSDVFLLIALGVGGVITYRKISNKPFKTGKIKTKP